MTTGFQGVRFGAQKFLEIRFQFEFPRNGFNLTHITRCLAVDSSRRWLAEHFSDEYVKQLKHLATALGRYSS